MLDVHMQQFIGAFYEAQVVGRMLLELTPAKMMELRMSIDERHAEALLLLRDGLKEVQTPVGGTAAVGAKPWTFQDAKEAIRACKARDGMDGLADDVIQKLASRVKCFEIIILVCTTLATAVSASTYGVHSEAVETALKPLITFIIFVATLSSGALNLLGWKDKVSEAEEMKRMVLQLNVAVYRGISDQDKTVEEVEAGSAEVERRYNALAMKFLGKHPRPPIPAVPTLYDYMGGILRRRFPAECARASPPGLSGS